MFSLQKGCLDQGRLAFKKWIKKFGSLDVDFIWKNHGKFMDSHLGQGKILFFEHTFPLQSLPLFYPCQRIFFGTNQLTVWGDDHFDSKGTFPLIEDLDDDILYYIDHNEVVVPLRKCSIAHTVSGISKSNIDASRKKKW